MTSLRHATAQDSDMILSWRNAPYIVARSSSRRVLSREEHAAWFPQALANPDCLMFVILVDRQPAGLARLDRQDRDSCVITAYLLEEFTGRGRGVEAIRAASRAAFERWEIQKIIACVREENLPGRNGFAKAGYATQASDEKTCPPGHICMVMTRHE